MPVKLFITDHNYRVIEGIRSDRWRKRNTPKKSFIEIQRKAPHR